MKVLAPWTNMKVTQQEHAYTVDVWGRTYTFDRSLFPTSIVSQGRELLSGPIALKMDFGHGEETPYNFRYQVLEAADDTVVVTSAALCGNIVVNAAVTLEYDGLIKLAVRLVPCGNGVAQRIEDWRDEWARTSKVLLQSARLCIPMRKEMCSLIHVWPATSESVGQITTVASGAFGDAAYPFKASVLMGNENVGLNLCMETDQNIQLADKAACIRTVCGENDNEFSLQLLSATPRQWINREESWDHPLEPISYVFLLEATPVKPLTRKLLDDWRVYQARTDGEDLELAAQAGAKWIHFHEEWGLIQNYGQPDNMEQIKAAVQKAHALGLKVMPYFGYEYSSAMIDWEKNKDNYLNKNVKGTFNGGWTRGHLYQKAYITCYKGGYSREMLDAAVRAMDELGFDGIYTDGTYIPSMCANENHGCGYRDEEGRLRATFPILAVREHVKKLYEQVHQRGGRIDAHQSSCCVAPLMAFCDSYWDGENLQGPMSEDLEGALSLEAFRSEFYGRNLGLTAQLIAYVVPPKYTMRNVLSVSLLHDVFPRPQCSSGKEELETVAKVWRAYDQFGVCAAQWKPYWKNTSSVKTEQAGIRISSFEKEDGILAFVSKFGQAAGMVTLCVPARFTSAYESFEDKTYPVVDGKVQLSINPTTIYMLRFA